jgi:ankyrin repeat protein
MSVTNNSAPSYIHTGQLGAVRLLLDRGADPSLADSDGDTPLMRAAGVGHVGVVRELAARGADLDAAHPKTGGTAFHFACELNQPECVAALLELGCDTTMPDAGGRTGKQRAVQFGHAAVLGLEEWRPSIRVAVATAAELCEAGLDEGLLSFCLPHSACL